MLNKERNTIRWQIFSEAPWKKININMDGYNDARLCADEHREMALTLIVSGIIVLCPTPQPSSLPASLGKYAKTAPFTKETN